MADFALLESPKLISHKNVKRQKIMKFSLLCSSDYLDTEYVTLKNFFDDFSPKITSNQLYTMLQKLSKFEVKAARHGQISNLLPLRFYVKSNFGELKRSKNVIFANFRDSEL